VRNAAARGEPVPEELEAWVAKVRERAYTATDADVDALRVAGYSEDQIFEVTVAAAVGAGLERFDAGIAALR
jgi:alkylhydroperoxidase family enzyme